MYVCMYVGPSALQDRISASKLQNIICRKTASRDFLQNILYTKEFITAEYII